jgi:thioredoxin reductase
VSWALSNPTAAPLETSIPGIFAGGDVRHGSMKRIAAAVGEGSSAIRSVHQAIGKERQVAASSYGDSGRELRILTPGSH